MVNLKASVEKIKSSDVFKKFKDLYLCSCFLINDSWQFDFYSKKDKRITSFVAEDEVKMVKKDEEVFQKEKTDLEDLDLGQVNINFDKAIKIVMKVKNKKYPGEILNKKFVVLQKVNVPLWNITYLTSGFNVFNIKINAETGEIISENLNCVLDFKNKP